MQPIIIPDDLNATFLQNLKVQLQPYVSRQETKIVGQRSRDSLSVLLPSINEILQKQNSVIRELASKWTSFIECWLKRSLSYQQELSFLNEELDQKQIEIDNLQEIVSHYEHKIPKLQMEIANYKKQVQSIHQKYQSLSRQYNQDKLSLRKVQQSYKKLQEEAKIDKTKFINEKTILIDQIKNEKNEKIEIIQKVIRLQEQKSQLQKENINAISQIKKYIHSLSSMISQRQQKIAQLKKNYQHLKAKNLDYSSCLCFHLKNKPNVHIMRETGEKRANLQNGPSSYFLTMSLNQLSEQHSIFYMQNQLKMHMDPYFAHFVLTSQSVKIKEDCQQLLNLDAKPFYSEIVQKRIPMHLWDQWIRNKLRQMLNLRKNNSFWDEFEQ